MKKLNKTAISLVMAATFSSSAFADDFTDTNVIFFSRYVIGAHVPFSSGKARVANLGDCQKKGREQAKLSRGITQFACAIQSLVTEPTTGKVSLNLVVVSANIAKYTGTAVSNGVLQVVHMGDLRSLDFASALPKVKPLSNRPVDAFSYAQFSDGAAVPANLSKVLKFAVTVDLKLCINSGKEWVDSFAGVTRFTCHMLSDAKRAREVVANYVGIPNDGLDPLVLPVGALYYPDWSPAVAATTLK